jgi:hypothetical protein
MKLTSFIIFLIVIILNTFRICIAEDELITEEYVTRILDGKDRGMINRQLKSVKTLSTKSHSVSLNVSFNDDGTEINENSYEMLNAIGRCIESSVLINYNFFIIGLIYSSDNGFRIKSGIKLSEYNCNQDLVSSPPGLSAVRTGKSHVASLIN